MTYLNKLNAGVATVALGLALVATPALADQTTPAADAPDSKDTIIVTGSSIKRKGLDTPSPLQYISNKEIQQSGYDTMASLLTNLTANGAGTLSLNNSEAFAGGASGIALRGLSVGATLTLIDGHRMVPYALADDGERQFVDISSIPFNAVDHIEVLKDGASATYGSDAIAGVVNVILKKQITGVQAMVEEGGSQHGGGHTDHYGFSAGKGDIAKDGYNAFVTVEYRSSEAIALSQRGDEPWGSLNYTGIGGNNLNPGAPNIGNNGLPATLTPYLVNPNTGAITFLGSGCNPTALAASQCTYKSPYQLQPASRNLDILVGFTKDFGDGWQAKFRGSLFDTHAQQNAGGINGYQAYPAGGAYGGGAYNVPGQPINASLGATSFILQNNLPGQSIGAGQYLQGVIPQIGMPTNDFHSNQWRVALDVTGQVAGFDVTASVGWSKDITNVTVNNAVILDNLYTLLNNASSVGLTPFNPLGGNSQADLNYIAPQFGFKATDSLFYGELDLSRKLFDLPGGDLRAALGLSYISKNENNPGPAEEEEGLVGGFNAYAIGKQNNKAAFGELDANMFKILNLNVSARDDYWSTYGNSFTPKAGFKLTPSSLFSLRGTYSKGFRAPSPAEEGEASAVFGLSATNNPILCPNGAAGPFPIGGMPSQCSVTPAFFQLTNPLKPEKSTSYTIGGVVTPAHGLSLTADYYHIQIKDQIVSASELPSPSASQFSCGFGPAIAQSGVVTGYNANGTPILGFGTPLVGGEYCETGYVNAQSTITSGLDFEAHYRFDVGSTKVSASATYTHMINYNLTSPAGTTFALAGTHGPSGVSGDTGNPRDHVNASLDLERGPLNLALNTYWISGYSVLDPSVGATTCAAGLAGGGAFANVDPSGIPTSYCRVKSFTSTNLSMSYKFNKNVKMNASISNLFDAKAPFDGQTYGGSYIPYNPALHEDGVVGRFFRLGFTFDY